MSQEINQSTPPLSPMGNNPQPGKRNNSAIYWVAIIILLGVCIFLFVSRNHMAQQNDITNKQIDSVKTDRVALQSDFDAASAKIDQLVSENVKMDSSLQNKQAELQKMKQQIKGILGDSKATASQLKQARELINSLNDKTKDYEARIAELEKENTALTGQNKSLTQERDSTVQQNIAIKKVGSVLHASNIRMEPIHKKRNGKEKETTKAKKVNDLRIMFDIDENRIADAGTKQLYLRILGPDGNVVSSAAYGSGNITTSAGSQVNYTLVKEVALQKEQPVKDITIDWSQDNDYKKGSYTIEIYNEGYKVGSGSVTLH